MSFLFRLRGLLFSLGGLCLGVAPFLPWLKLDILGLKLGIPGFFWHGAWLSVLGTLIVLVSLSRWRRLSPAVLLLSGCAAYLLWQDAEQVWTRGDYFLAQWQLRLAPLNQMLAQLNLRTLEIYHHTQPQERMGEGLYLALAGLLVVTGGWVSGVLWEIRLGASPLSVVLGSPRCRHCQFAVRADMRFCPGCGVSRSKTPACRRCGEPLAKGYLYCSECGEAASPS